MFDKADQDFLEILARQLGNALAYQIISGQTGDKAEVK